MDHLGRRAPPCGRIHPEASLNTQIRFQKLTGPRLVEEYLAGRAEAMPFFAGAPCDLESFRQKWEEVRHRFGRAERELAARALRPTSERARERLAAFVEHGGAMITTGQQAGLFTGPLYTLYKALTAVRLAEALEAELRVTVLPVFWVASEDHDWAEVNHAYLLDASDELRRLVLPDQELRPVPIGDRVLAPGVRTVLDEAADALAGQPFTAECLRLLRDEYRAGRSVAQAFAGVMARLLAPYDVLLTDAADPHLKRASVPVLSGALRAAERQEEALRARSADLRAAGYHEQVAVLDAGTNVFYHGPGGRERLYRDRGGYRGRESGIRLPADEAIRELEAHPERYSPNVLLRPVVESAVFPTLAYVGGPGEISYLAQLGVLFPEYGMAPPVAFPRASVTLVEPPVEHILTKLEMPVAHLARPRHELVQQVVASAMPPRVRGELDALGAAIAEGYRRLAEAAAPADPGLSGALGAIRNESLSLVNRAERKVLRALRERERTRIAQLDRARLHLYPGGEPQERVLNVFSPLARHGFGLLEELRAGIPLAWTARVG